MLGRLKTLNAAYERLYPGLIYITFVNGRSRAQIRDELEEKLRAQQVVVGQDNNDEVDVPQIHDIESEEWQREVTRAVDDVGRIAKSRLGVLGLA